MLNCHCRDCQRANGSAYAALMIVPKDAVQIEGEPQYYKIKSDRGSLPNVASAPPVAAKLLKRLAEEVDAAGPSGGSLGCQDRRKARNDAGRGAGTIASPERRCAYLSLVHTTRERGTRKGCGTHERPQTGREPTVMNAAGDYARRRS